MRERITDQSAEELQEAVIAIDRVARVVAGGRRFRFRTLVVVGDRRGRVGMGVAKATEVSASVQKALAKAKKGMIEVPLTKSGTIPHEVSARFAGSQVLLKPAGPGTGVIAGGTVRQILDVCGVRDILSKAFGSTNKLNSCYATMQALSQLVPRPEPPPKGPKAANKGKASI